MINVSGHRMGTAEVESALVLHHDVAEAAVVGMPHDIKGQGIYAYVTLNSDVAATPELAKALKAWVRQEIGPIATPDAIQFAPGLPKTRSGKIMRRILRKIAEGDDRRARRHLARSPIRPWSTTSSPTASADGARRDARRGRVRHRGRRGAGARRP